MKQKTNNKEQITKNIKQKNLLSVKCGQTMIEVVVALMLITLFLAGITIVQLYAAKNINYSEKKSTATRLARQQLERARVVRDMGGIEALKICQSECYINYKLTPVPIVPTGSYTQKLQIITSAEANCPLPQITTTSVPNSYQAIANVAWDSNINVTPAPIIEMTSCITDWR